MKVINLFVPYFKQLDNVNNPHGSCNVTSVAMCLAYFGIKGNGQGQLEDQLYKWMIDNNLSRHSPHDLQKLVISRGIKDDYNSNRSIDDIKKALDQSKPVILHGYFTRFGHIIVVKGYTDKGFICGDPYGEWFPSGYRTDLTGKDVVYSYAMIRQTCCDPGVEKSIWAHFISK